MPVTTARQKVLDYLRKNRAVSAAQIGRALKMSAATVRHHLSVLTGDGRVEEIGATQKEGRGRPVKLFGLSEKLMGNNLPLLADVLLTEFFAQMPPSKREAVIRAVAKRIADSGNPLGENVPMTKRLALVVEKLNSMNYQARWEAGAGGPRILFGYCPYAGVVKKHPELCRMDLSLLEIYLARPISRTTKSEIALPVLCPFAFEIG